jgi:hypothetical protein
MNNKTLILSHIESLSEEETSELLDLMFKKCNFTFNNVLTCLHNIKGLYPNAFKSISNIIGVNFDIDTEATTMPNKSRFTLNSNGTFIKNILVLEHTANISLEIIESNSDTISDVVITIPFNKEILHDVQIGKQYNLILEES